MPAMTPAQILKKMSDLDLQTPEKEFIGLLYGPSGTGKTVLSMEMAQALTVTGRILYLDSSDGWVTLDQRQHRHLKKGASYLSVDNYDMLYGVAQALHRRSKGFEDFDVIVIDEHTSMAENTLDEVVEDVHGDVNAEVEGKDYRPAQRLTMNALNLMHDTEGLHVILVGHDRQDGDARKVVTTSPGYSPKLGKAVMKRMHLVGHVTAEIKGAGDATSYNRKVQTQPSRLIAAKSRVGGLGFSSSFGQLIDGVIDWVEGSIAEDLQLEEPNVEIADDEIPYEGIEPPEDDDDDAPVYTETED